MHEPSDETERQLKHALAAAADAARRAITARQRAIEQAQRDGNPKAAVIQAQIDAERQLAAAYLEPVFDPAWWVTASPRDVADMWRHANSWREPDRDLATPTIFDHAAARIHEEVGARVGLDATEVLAHGDSPNRSHERATISDHALGRRRAELPALKRDLPAPPGLDDPHARAAPRAVLAAG